ncbi:hypothetical protein CB0940_00473 [Cercospora beticola]|uniref:Uncharacterized protein n=1 Tax=Cercospora beticola TaxID=122368 RepID=A0A2G5IAR2_CERBT|nr:hypothetical protein CB0940_00473 [Cercospora beticola]PIB01772.1 hypothetical protein CB0940_00473 [Cercospora beticola]WPA95889.1 hypothetical protein RHO25_000493 [Cercospora beticola]
MDQVSTTSNGVAAAAGGGVSIGAAIGIAFGASAVTAVTILLLWWNSRRRANSRARRGGVEFGMMNGEDRRSLSVEEVNSSSPAPEEDRSPSTSSLALEEMLDLDSTRATPASVRSTPSRSKHEPNLDSISEASEPSTTSSPAATPPLSNLYTPSLYRAAPPDSIQQQTRLAPPNLTTEYSIASLEGYEEFAPWIDPEAIQVRDEQDEQQGL